MLPRLTFLFQLTDTCLAVDTAAGRRLVLLHLPGSPVAAPRSTAAPGIPRPEPGRRSSSGSCSCRRRCC